MTAQSWNGPGDYDIFLPLSQQEMAEMSANYHLAPKHWYKSCINDRYFCLANSIRKALALLPFLSFAFGGMYDELPMGDDWREFHIRYADYAMEEVSY